jgi:hypothetical protein
MAFRNPVTSLPASSITGQITGPQIAAGAITADKIDVNALNGKVITGSTVQTAASGRRIVLAPDGNLYLYTGASGEFNPAEIFTDGSSKSLQLLGPDFGATEYGLTLTNSFGTSSATLAADTVTASGIFAADNIQWGKTNITPVANTPTSVTVSGLFVTGSTFIGLAVPNTTVPGTQVQGVGISSVTSDGCVLTLTRTNTTVTTIYWAILGF